MAEVGKKTDKEPEITKKLKALIERFKAGSPTDSNTYWISLKPFAIAKLFEEEQHIKISSGVVKWLLKELGYGFRKQAKQLATTNRLMCGCNTALALTRCKRANSFYFFK